MKRYLISFADSRMKNALNRLRKQAGAMDFFDRIELYTESDFEQEFIQENKEILKPYVRGFGYWKWKPYLIQKKLHQMQDGDELYYIDAGCHLNPHGRKRMLEYAEILRESQIGIAAFHLGPTCSDRAYTKMDLLVHMGVENNPKILDSGQVCGTHVFVVKKTSSVEFIKKWNNIATNIHYIDDSPSLLPNFPGFVEHRHDQSVFSILSKLHGVTLLPGNETWPANNTRDWSTLADYPIWDKRDLGISSHLIFRLIRKIRKVVKRFSTHR